MTEQAHRYYQEPVERRKSTRVDLSDGEKFAIEKTIERLTEKIGNVSCCPLDDEAKKEAPHLFGMFKNEGNNDISKGIEDTREVIKWSKSFRKWNNSLLSTALKVLIGALLAGALGIFLSGVKIKITG